MSLTLYLEATTTIPDLFIKKTDTEKRGTCLAKRLRAAMQ